MKGRLLPLAVGLLAVASGCASESAVRPAAAPAAAPPPPGAADVAPAPAIPSEASSLRDETTVQGRAAHAAVDFRAAGEALEASSGSCPNACRALGSMDRAAGRLCGLVSSGEDPSACKDATSKLLLSRERVRAACGSCPGGPTVDPNAPAPTP